VKPPIAALLLIALVSSAAADDLKGNCDVRFLATSTLHDFAGTARCQPFTVTLAGGTDGRPVIPGVEIAVPVAEMDTENRKRDRQLREMFQGDRFPLIRAVLSKLDPDGIRQQMRQGPNGKGSVEFTLRIRDIEHRIRADIRNLRETPGRVSFDAEFPVSLKKYDLKPPSPFFGAIRVGDTVTVNIAFRLEGATPK
jgi:hypothetical protein